VQRFPLPGWIHLKALPDSGSTPVLTPGLGPGETETILLALELQPDRIILDDGAARSAARSHGLRIIGVLAILFSAKNLGALSSVRDEVDKLMKASFRVSAKVYRDLPVRTGEIDTLTMYP
jgi:predicted nucleic acid-binding protein